MYICGNLYTFAGNNSFITNMIKYFNIIQSLCRACFSSDLDIMIHQIERLISAYRADGNIDEAKALEKMLNSAKNKEVLNPSVITSSSCLHGETLTPKTIIPVDKEKVLCYNVDKI